MNSRILLILALTLIGACASPAPYTAGSVVVEPTDDGEMVKLPLTTFHTAWDAKLSFAMTARRDDSFASLVVQRSADSFQYSECETLEVVISPKDRRKLEFSYKRDLDESYKPVERLSAILTTQDLEDMISVKTTAIAICGDEYPLDTDDMRYIYEFTNTWKGRE